MKKLILLALLVSCKKETVQPTPDPEPVPVKDYKVLTIKDASYYCTIELSNKKWGSDSIITVNPITTANYTRSTKFKYATISMVHPNGGKIYYSILVDGNLIKSIQGAVKSSVDTLSL